MTQIKYKITHIPCFVMVKQSITSMLEKGYKIQDYIHHKSDDHYTVTVANEQDPADKKTFATITKEHLDEYLEKYGELQTKSKKTLRQVLESGGKLVEYTPVQDLYNIKIVTEDETPHHFSNVHKSHLMTMPGYNEE